MNCHRSALNWSVLLAAVLLVSLAVASAQTPTAQTPTQDRQNLSGVKQAVQLQANHTRRLWSRAEAPCSGRIALFVMAAMPAAERAGRI